MGCRYKTCMTTATGVCACSSLMCLCIAVTTEKWLYAMELVADLNGTTSYMNTTTGLWKKCVQDARSVPSSSCSRIDYFTNTDKNDVGPTDSILLSLRWVTLFSMISLLLQTLAVTISTIAQCDETKMLLTFMAGICFVVGGLCTLVGIIVYVSAITEETGNKPRITMDEPKFVYHYGLSFFMIAGSFFSAELSGVLSVYLYIYRYKESYRKRKEQAAESQCNNVTSRTLRESESSPVLQRTSPWCSRQTSRDDSPSREDGLGTPVSDNYTCRERLARDYTVLVSPGGRVHGIVPDRVCGFGQLDVDGSTDTYRRTTPV